MGRTAGIRRPRRRFEPEGTGPAPVPIRSNFVPASVAPAGAELVEGWRVKPPPLAFLGPARAVYRADAKDTVK